MNSFSKKFFLEIESEKNIQSSTEKTLKNCNNYFHTTVTEIKSCEELLHKRLKNILVYKMIYFQFLLTMKN